MTRFSPVFFMRAVSQRFPQMTVHIYQFMGLWIGDINHLIQLFKKFPNMFHKQSSHFTEAGLFCADCEIAKWYRADYRPLRRTEGAESPFCGCKNKFIIP